VSIRAVVATVERRMQFCPQKKGPKMALFRVQLIRYCVPSHAQPCVVSAVKALTRSDVLSSARGWTRVDQTPYNESNNGYIVRVQAMMCTTRLHTTFMYSLHSFTNYFMPVHRSLRYRDRTRSNSLGRRILAHFWV
jgi:hypothetical protein